MYSIVPELNLQDKSNDHNMDKCKRVCTFRHTSLMAEYASFSFFLWNLIDLKTNMVTKVTSDVT